MLSKQRRKLIQDFLKQKQISENKWHCCNQDYDSIAQVGRHVDQTHQQDLDQLEQQLTEKKQQTETLKKLTQRRGEKVNIRHDGVLVAMWIHKACCRDLQIQSP
jgi:hypothetical protein